MASNRGNAETSSFDHEEDLPEGWTLTHLEDICAPPQYGWTTSAVQNGHGLKLLRTTDISGGSVDWSKVPGCKEEPENTERYLLSPGDIVVSRAGSVGVSYLIKDCPKAIFASYLIRVRPLRPIQSEFIGYFFHSPQYWDAIAEETSGVTIPNVNASKLKRLLVPLPPLAEQRRIVAKIEELLARVNATRERLARVPTILKRFRQTVLAAACSGRLTEDWRTSKNDFESAELRVERACRARVAEYEKLCSVAAASGLRKPRRPSNLEPKIRSAELGQSIPQGWFWASVEDIASIRQHALSSGPFGSALGTKDYRASGIPVIRGQNIQDGEFLSTNLTYVSTEKATTLSRSAAYPGDIVVVAVGSSGQAAVVPDNMPRSILSQNCNKITVDESLVIPEFALLSLRNDIARDQLAERTTDTARPFLSLTNLKRTIIAIPSLDEQREIVRRSKALFKLADAVGSRIDAVWKYTEKLTQSILGGAFRGELVPTEAEVARREGRLYESASELLERIKAERKSTMPPLHSDRGTSRVVA